MMWGEEALMKSLTALVIVMAWVLPSPAITIDTVPVDNPGNAADGLGHGSVAYSYRIGKYEVTNAQYVEFLNGVDPTGVNLLGLYNSGMTSFATGGIIRNPASSDGQKYVTKTGRGDNPVVLVSWFDSIRFANWMQNGQRHGDTEHGAYTLPAFNSNGIPADPFTAIQRSAGAQWFLPNYDEWYKAAYFKNDGSAGSSWQYPTASNSDPLSTPPPGLGGIPVANAGNIAGTSGYALTHRYYDPAVNYLTDVGAYKYSASPYGTFDQAGNVWEWDDGAAKLGGGFDSQLLTMTRNYAGSMPSPSYEDYDAGFRLATIAVPEATTLTLARAAVAMFPPTRRRKSVPHNRV
jgi:sulfatase modifying factor 1